MPFTREQLKAYWQTNKEALNQKRRERRRLAKLGLATNQVSHAEVSQVEPLKVSHFEVSHQQVEPVNAKTANLNEVEPKTANLETVNLNEVSHVKPENNQPSSEMANPKLIQLIKEWQTQTNYNCVATCYRSYCNNC